MSASPFMDYADFIPDNASLTPQERLRINLRGKVLWGTVNDFAIIMKVTESECVDLLSMLVQQGLITVRVFSDRKFNEIRDQSVKDLKYDSVIEVIWLGEKC